MEHPRGAAQVPLLGRRLPLRALVGAALFIGFGALGRAAVVDDAAVSLVWPAAWVGALWLSSGNRATWVVDVPALALASLTVNLLTGASVAASPWFAASTLLQSAAFAGLARRWLPEVWGLGGRTGLSRLADLGRLVVASIVACILGAAVGIVGLWVTHVDVDGLSFSVWWVRNAVNMVAFGVLALVAGQQVCEATSAGHLREILYRSVHARSVPRLVEAELLAAASVGLYGLIFGRAGAESLSFLVLAVSVWAGLRFSPVVVIVHGFATGVAGIAFTIAGSGPFTSIDSLVVRGLVGQVFVVTTVLTGLSLAFSRLERDQAATYLAQARRESDERARLLRAVLDSMHEGLVVVEEGGRILLTNAATPRLLGIHEMQTRLRPAAAYGLFHADGTPLSDDDLPGLRTLDSAPVPPIDFHLRVDSVPRGRVLEVSVEPLPRQKPDDRPLAMINLRDVTLDRQHRDALASFAGVVAHDLFSPLTVVTGWAESLSDEFAEGDVPAAVGLPMVERLESAANHMRHIIGDLLAYTVAQDQSLRLEPVDLTAEVSSLAQLRAGGASAPVISVADGMHVWGEPGLVRQLFDNLLGNAVKYVAPGTRPRIDVQGRRDGDWLEVRVADNGIGIPQDQRELVFETFHRAHRDDYEGTGLGLAICRRIAERHRGSIHAEPGADGVGTVIVVRLPVNATGYNEASDVETAATPTPVRAERRSA